MKKQFDGDGYRWLWHALRGRRWVLFAAVAARVAASGMLALLAMVSKSLIDGATAGVFNEFVRLGVCVLALALGRLFLLTGSNLMVDAASEKLCLERQREMVERILGADERAVEQYHSGVLMERITEDIDDVCVRAFSLPIKAVASVSDLVFGTLALMVLDSRLLLFVIFVGICAFVGSRLMRPAIQRRFEAMRTAADDVHAGYQESVEQRMVVKAFHGQRAIDKWLSALNGTYYRAWKKYLNIRVVTGTALGSFYSAGYYLILLFCAYRLFQGTLTFGAVTAVLQLLSQLMTPFADLSGLLPILYATLSSVKRIVEVETLPAESAGNALKPSEVALESIEAKGLCFAYDARALLRDVRFLIPRGAFVLISGESGAGKSTLVKLLLGLYPAENLVLHTSAGDLPPGCDTRGLFAYVPQGHMLLSGTLRDSLTFFAGQKTDEEIFRALRVSCAEDFVKNTLSDGLDTRIGERSLGISEGQAQRLAVARALLSDAPILLLDEATSALDPELEEKMLENLKRLPGKTVLLVSHKPAARLVADMEIHFENGRAITTERT